MENEYIIRDEAMNLPVLPKEQRIQLLGIDEAFEEGWRQALENLAILPAADVVKVVRCRECIYNRGETKDLLGNPAILCVTAVTHKPDWYCASGKRKDGGQDE